MLVILSGLTLFLAGIRLTSDHLQAAFGTHLRRTLAQFSRTPWRATLIGGLMTALTQSATLITILTAQFTSAGIFTFKNALAVMVGAGIGGTLLVQLLAFDIQLVYPLLALSLLLRSRRLLGGHLGGALLGLGLLLLGQQVMLGAVSSLEQDQLVGQVIEALARQPFLLFAVGLLLAIMIQSSNAVTILALSLNATRLLDEQAALLVIVGANVGSPVTTLLSTWSGEVAGRRVALGHLLLKLVAAALLLPFAATLVRWLGVLSSEPSRLLANAHTLFNAAALLGLPLSAWLERLCQRLLPTPERQDGPRYLDAGALDTPHLAYGLAYRETVRVAEGVHQLYQLAGQSLAGQNVKAAVAIQEKTIDYLVQEVVAYLVQIAGRVSQEQLSSLLDSISELEALADLCKRLARQPNKLIIGGQTLHPESSDELQQQVARLERQIQETVTFLGVQRAPLEPGSAAVVRRSETVAGPAPGSPQPAGQPAGNPDQHRHADGRAGDPRADRGRVLPPAQRPLSVRVTGPALTQP